MVRQVLKGFKEFQVYKDYKARKDYKEFKVKKETKEPQRIRNITMIKDEI